MSKTWKKISMIILVVFILFLCGQKQLFANFTEVNLDIEKLLQMKAETMIFTDNGSKLAILLQEKTPQIKRKQVIYIYDFIEDKWTKISELSEGVIGELEPLAFSKDGRMLAVRLREDLLIIDTIENKLTHHIREVGSMTEAAFSPDGRYLAFLIQAEWELPTDLLIFDLQSTEEELEKRLIPALVYDGEYKAAGPISWSKDSSSIYFIEEFTWGTINSRGVLKKYNLLTKEVSEEYDFKAPTSRVNKYYYSPEGNYRALILRDLDKQLENSRYGLLIQKEGKFVYGCQIDDWRDSIDLDVSEYLSSAGWLGNKLFYWINRSLEGSELYIYDVDEDKVVKEKYSEQIYITPAGVIIKMING